MGLNRNSAEEALTDQEGTVPSSLQTALSVKCHTLQERGLNRLHSHYCWQTLDV